MKITGFKLFSSVALIAAMVTSSGCRVLDDGTDTGESVSSVPS